MSLFKSLFGAQKVEEESREHDRTPGHGCRVRIDSKEYQVHDLSMGGFRLHPYDGPLIAKQYFDFKFLLVLNGESYEVPAHGYVVRIDEEGLAAKFQKPQPFFRHILNEYIEVTRTM